MAKFISRVFIVVEASDEAEACDAMSGALTESLKYNDLIVEWSYSKDHGGYVYPKPLPEPFASADLEDVDLDAPFEAAQTACDREVA